MLVLWHCDYNFGYLLFLQILTSHGCQPFFVGYGSLWNSSFLFGGASLLFEVRVVEGQGSNGGVLNIEFCGKLGITHPAH